MAVLAVLGGVATRATASTKDPAWALPSTYTVSNEAGVTPEGITVTADGTMYVTSNTTGAVYRGDVRNPAMRLFLPAGSDGRTAAAGIHTDRYGRIFIAGFSTATLYVYSPNGRLLAARKAADPAALLNDLAFTADAVYVTDSATGTLWRASLTATTVGPLTAWLTPDAFPTPPVFLNGIVTSPDGRLALVSDQGTDQLLRVDLSGRKATLVAVTGDPMAGDGLLLEGSHLYAVINFFGPDGVSILLATRLAVVAPGWRTATVVAMSKTVDAAQTPTTIARDNYGRLLWVNSQIFATEQKPPYTVTQVPGLA